MLATSSYGGEALNERGRAVLLDEGPGNVVDRHAGVLSHGGKEAFNAIGPGSTEFTVTPVGAVNSARPRAMASCAVLVMPYRIISLGRLSPD